MTDWRDFALGASSTLGVGAILSFLRYYLAQGADRVRRRVELSEMVGAVRGELSSVHREFDMLSDRLSKVESALKGLEQRIAGYVSRHRRPSQDRAG